MAWTIDYISYNGLYNDLFSVADGFKNMINTYNVTAEWIEQ